MDNLNSDCQMSGFESQDMQVSDKYHIPICTLESEGGLNIQYEGMFKLIQLKNFPN